jgi:hypothetical protein
MIKFKQDIRLEVIEGFDERTDMIIDKVEESFKAGEKVDAEIYSEHGNYVDLQYGDGSITLGVPKDSFEVID